MGTPIEGGEVQGTEPPPGIGEESSPGQNPAWGEALSAIPEQFHQVLTPHFQQWDQAAQKRIEEANASVKQFEPYKQFVENGISAEEVGQGLQFLYELNNNPQAVYEAIAQAYGFNSQATEVEESEEEEEESTNFQDPRFDQLQQGLDIVAQTILQQEQKKIEAEAEAEIDTELETLREKHPGIPDEFILPLMINGFDVNQIGERWQNLSQSILQQNPRPFAPQVMGSNGGGAGLPSQAIDPKSLSGPDRRALVAQMLNAANNS